MTIGKVRVQEQGGPWGPFQVQQQENRGPVVRAGSMWAKMSLCAGVLAVALVLELAGVGKEQPQAVFSQEEEQEEQKAPGALYLVAAEQPGKWAPPVAADEVSFVPEGLLVGFCAQSRQVISACAGRVLTIGEDETYGTFVCVGSEGDVTVTYYGLEEALCTAGQELADGDVLGSVPLGRTVYLGVQVAGEAQDPRNYVAMTVERRA